MDNQKDNTISDTVLPKLIRDKITNYQIANAVNESVDEYRKQIMNMIMNLQHQANGASIKLLKVCNGYDFHDGKKKFCNKYECTNPSSRMNRAMYICECCKNPKTSYCKEHVQGNLFWAKYDYDMDSSSYNKSTHVVVCDDCYPQKAKVFSILRITGKQQGVMLSFEDIIPTSV
ncbi:MAG: hypothetical protein WD512_03510 [Candidatus Paceibacterota bacterium]